MLVYAAIFPNGKKYIGATTQTLEKRKQDHISAAKSVDNKFYRALNKYGVENVEFRKIRDFETIEQMFHSEQVLIHRHRTQVNGYNTTAGGEGNPGRILTPENRIKISEGQKKRYNNPSEREKISLKVKNWINDNPELVKVNSEKKLSVIKSEEFKKKQSEIMKQVYNNKPELKIKISEATKKVYANNPEVKIKISKKLGGRPMDVYKDNELIGRCQTKGECVERYGVGLGNLCMVLNGDRNHTKGLVFKYSEETNENT